MVFQIYFKIIHKFLFYRSRKQYRLQYVLSRHFAYRAVIGKKMCIALIARMIKLTAEHLLA